MIEIWYSLGQGYCLTLCILNDALLKFLRVKLICWCKLMTIERRHGIIGRFVSMTSLKGHIEYILSNIAVSQKYFIVLFYWTLFLSRFEVCIIETRKVQLRFHVSIFIMLKLGLWKNFFFKDNVAS